MEPIPDPNARLAKLLALKRFENPPPGFFERFSDRVLINIKAGSATHDEGWWERLLRQLRVQPMMAGSYAVLALGGVLFGLSLYHSGRSPAPALWPAGAQMGTDYLREWAAPVAGTRLALPIDPALALGGLGSNETTIRLGPSVLFRPAGALSQPVDFRPSE
jgi:hypothetical protein